MARLIQCFEPEARPGAISMELEPGDAFCVFMLDDALEEGAGGLRSTILRRAGEAPPPKSVFLMELVASAVGDRWSLRVRRVNREMSIETQRAEARVRVTRGNELHDEARFEVALVGLRTVVFTLRFAELKRQGGEAAVGGAGSRSSRAMAGAVGSFWLVPTAMAILSAPKARVMNTLVKWGKKAGISPGMLLLAIGVLIPLVVTLVWGYLQSRAATQAKLEAAEAGEKLGTAEAALDAALQAEAACVAQRKDVVAALKDLEAKRALQAEIALATPLAQTLAVELGGARMGDESLVALDVAWLKGLREQVVFDLEKLDGTPEDATRCLAQASALGQDLPSFILLWHPDPTLVCPLGYELIDEGVDRMGSWGLSARASSAFGPKAPGHAAGGMGAELRMNDRWASHTLADGVRGILTTILTAETANRPPVAPSQAHLWALALWDAYNRLPVPADGALDKSAEDCVDGLMKGLLDSDLPTVPGQPILPDITLVALGEISPPAKPTAGCPWPAEALPTGAKAALRAVAHQADLEGAPSK
ncbi:MAG: hypothetical protein ABIO70_25020 [Pseudomonadota bacterium]